jgi:hypothetical protein
MAGITALMQESKQPVSAGISIIKMATGDWIGCELLFGKYLVRFVISSQNLCCESFGIRVDNEYIDEKRLTKTLKGFVLQRCEYNNSREKILKEELGSTVCMTLVGTEKNIDVDIYCNHNGYYPHDVEVSWGKYSSTHMV